MVTEFENQYASISFSQEGEDLILGRIFERKQSGFYIDVGAYHPVRFSNTLYFYKKGWRGINIEPMPGSLELFNSMRPADINIEAAVSDKEELLEYNSFNEGALNTFSPELARERAGMNGYFVEFQKKIKTRRLEDILDESLPPGQVIDFMSIDTEGYDLKVLRSNNWQKYRPQIVITEMFDFSIDKILGSKLYSFMTSIRYSFFAKTFNSVFFRDNN